MENLLTYFGQRHKNQLNNLINEPGLYDIPSVKEVTNYLENTDDDKSSEKTIGDLSIQFSNKRLTLILVR